MDDPIDSWNNQSVKNSSVEPYLERFSYRTKNRVEPVDRQQILGSLSEGHLLRNLLKIHIRVKVDGLLDIRRNSDTMKRE